MLNCESPGFSHGECQLTEFFLGYEDDGYGDNGYYSHDNGTGNQCLDVGDAWVTLIHP